MTEATTGACVHHWVLGTPEDEVIPGRCKRCGATRDYPAAMELAIKPPVEEEAPPAAVLVEIESTPSLVGASA